MRLRSLILLLLLIFVSLPILAAEPEEVEKEVEKPWWVEVETASGKTQPSRVKIWYQRDIVEDKFGLYVLAEQESIDKFREAFIGFRWKPVPWLEVGTSIIGRETDSLGLRSSRRHQFIDVKLGDFALSANFEAGSSDKWRKITATYAFSERFGAGVMNEKGRGLGPLLEYDWKEEDVKVWVGFLSGSLPNLDGVFQRSKTLVIGVNKIF